MSRLDNQISYVYQDAIQVSLANFLNIIFQNFGTIGFKGSSEPHSFSFSNQEKTKRYVLVCIRTFCGMLKFTLY